VLVAGSLADRFGRRRTFVVGLGIFTLASGAIALAPDATFLNVMVEVADCLLDRAARPVPAGELVQTIAGVPHRLP
jgi:MFS family permease